MLFFQVGLFGKLLCFSDKNTSYFDGSIFSRMKPGKYFFFQIFLKKDDIKFVGYYRNGNMKLKKTYK